MENEYVTVVVRLGMALLVGGIIGIERTYHGRPAGFRTHTLVCTASSLLMVLMVFQWQLIPSAPMETIRVDPTRMAQGIMTGIGFLGAGVIMKERFTVRGLTTAASIWITASIGIIIGMGFYFAASVATVFTLGTLSLFRWVESIMPMFSYGRLMIRCAFDQRISEEALEHLIKDPDLRGSTLSYHVNNERNTIQYQMAIRTKDTENFTRLAASLSQIQGVNEYSIIPSSS